MLIRVPRKKRKYSPNSSCTDHKPLTELDANYFAPNAYNMHQQSEGECFFEEQIYHTSCYFSLESF